MSAESEYYRKQPFCFDKKYITLHKIKKLTYILFSIECTEGSLF